MFSSLGGVSIPTSFHDHSASSWLTIGVRLVSVDRMKASASRVRATLRVGLAVRSMRSA